MEQAVDAARAPAATLAYGAHRAASLSPAPSLQAALPGGAAVEPVPQPATAPSPQGGIARRLTGRKRTLSPSDPSFSF